MRIGSLHKEIQKKEIVMEENKNFTAEDIDEAANVSSDDAEGVNEQANEFAEDDDKLSGKEKKKNKKLEAEIEKLNAVISEEQDKYMRLYAEYDNFRRRSTKEREGIYTDAYCDALVQILPILDTLERAAQFSAEDADTPMAKGLELTLKSFAETLSKMGVCEIEALGKEFDPNLHNAVMHVEDETVGESTVVEVFMKGYKKGDKILRHAMVKVAN